MQPAPNRRNKARLVLLAILVFGGASQAIASAGTISSSHKYAFSNIAGYVNFAPTNSTVSVTDTALTGYAWSANDGWINLAPSHGGVKNDGMGHLSGFAWDPIAGWVNFTGVTIDASGKFHGMATGATVNGASYAINFDCTSCDVETAWRITGAISPVYVAPAAPSNVSGSEPAALPTPALAGPGSKASSGTAVIGKGSMPALVPRTPAAATASHPTASSSAIKAPPILTTTVSSFSVFLRSLGRAIADSIVTFVRLLWRF